MYLCDGTKVNKTNWKDSSRYRCIYISLAQKSLCILVRENPSFMHARTYHTCVIYYTTTAAAACAIQCAYTRTDAHGSAVSRRLSAAAAAAGGRVAAAAATAAAPSLPPAPRRTCGSARSSLSLAHAGLPYYIIRVRV